MEKQELNELIKRYLNGNATDQDYLLLDSWYLSLYKDQPMLVSDADRIHDLDEVKTNIDRVINGPTVKIWPGITAVAAILAAVCSMAIYFYPADIRQPEKIKAFTAVAAHDILPGGNNATLILSDGTPVNLKNSANGKTITQPGAIVVKTADGMLGYTAVSNSIYTGEYNDLKTPNGGTYQIKLPDGTRVWLNAASTLKYPTSFSSLKERKVELSGEAYFEVARNKKIPFIVITGQQTVEVLGTHFNISSYRNEIIKTTLLEGRIRINKKTTLAAGQQALNYGREIKVNYADTESAVDWKNGKFSFNQGQDFQSAMHQIERWYDVKFIYQNGIIPDMEPRGRLSRNHNLSTVLDGIQDMGKVHFKIEGRSVLVTR